MKTVRHLALPVIGGLGLLCMLLGLVLPARVAHASSTWTLTGSLNAARSGHTATLLQSGKVLVAGGRNGSGELASAELYDPSTGSWSATGSLNVARELHTATLLQSGQVLVAGGFGGSGSSLASAELYDPGTGSWSATGSLVADRVEHTATLLQSGKVLVTGGFGSSGFLASAELFTLDTTAPTLSLPGTITVNASSPSGAVVTYTVSASDPDDPSAQLTISCSPASGSTFAIGTTTVNCTASDPAGNSSSGSFQVVVQDGTAPTLSLPSTITVNATSPQGAKVTYTVTATDPDNPSSQLTISCSPASGSTFAIGTTMVKCTASDPAGNSSSGSFSVVVKGAAAQVNDLISLVNSFHLSGSLQNALDNKLKDVLGAINAGQTATACSELTDFIGFVQSHSGKGLTTSQANQLIAAATNIKKVLGC